MNKLLSLLLLFGLPFILAALPATAQTQLNLSDWYCDKRFTNGRAVIVGTVVKIGPAEKLPRYLGAKFRELANYSVKNVIEIRIDKSYRNDFDRSRYALNRAEINVPNLQTEDSQAKLFKLGEKYLFYLNAITASKDDLVSFYIVPNSQTKLFSESDNTIAFLENVYKLDVMKDVLGFDGKDELIGGIISGKAISLPKPAYPDEAKIEKASEAIHVYVLIDETGQVVKAKALCVQHASLTKAAEHAALNAKFSPILVSGKPIKAQGIITYNFVP